MEKRVFISKCNDYEQAVVDAAVLRVLDEFGGAGAILGGGKKVLVKPNILIPKKPEDAATTHPAVVEAVCRAFVNAGADVAIIDSTGGPHTKLVLRLLYGKTGIKAAAERGGAKASFNTRSRAVDFPQGKALNKFDILAPVLDADLVVSLAKVKTHGFMSMSGCVKNMFGCIPGMGKPLLHRKFPKRENFAAMLVDICEFVKPGFSILDGVYGMEGPGPSGGTPKHLGAIIGGISPHAVDLAQCHLMGLRTDSVYTLMEAAERGFAPSNPDELTWLGDNQEEIRTAFKPAAKHKSDNVPTILENCTGCGDCARICPMKCIEIRKEHKRTVPPQQKKIAVIDEKPCIRCYCCHEFCPAKAISL